MNVFSCSRFTVWFVQWTVGRKCQEQFQRTCSGWFQWFCCKRWMYFLVSLVCVEAVLWKADRKWLWERQNVPWFSIASDYSQPKLTKIKCLHSQGRKENINVHIHIVSSFFSYALKWFTYPLRLWVISRYYEWIDIIFFVTHVMTFIWVKHCS